MQNNVRQRLTTPSPLHETADLNCEPLWFGAAPRFKHPDLVKCHPFQFKAIINFSDMAM
jgi:hypothetical protein